MSRNSARRGGGSRSKTGSARTARIGGFEIAYDDGLDEHLKTRVQPAPLFPQYQPPEPLSLTKSEQEEVTRFLFIRKRFRDGPLYASIGANTNTRRTNPFEGMGAYSQKYIQRTRTVPVLASKSRDLENYPKELWPVVDPKATRLNGTTYVKRPGQRRSPPANRIKLEDINDDEDADENPDDEIPEQELDDEYESDEEEMAGDYNAEQYFDNGGEDAGDDYDLEGGDGGDAFN